MNRKTVILITTLSLTFGITGCLFSSIKSAQNEYTASGTLSYSGQGLEGITIIFSNDYGSVTTDEQGRWSKPGLVGEVTATPTDPNWIFTPTSITLSFENPQENFIATPANSEEYTASGTLSYSGQRIEGIIITFSNNYGSVTTDE